MKVQVAPMLAECPAVRKSRERAHPKGEPLPSGRRAGNIAGISGVGSETASMNLQDETQRAIADGRDDARGSGTFEAAWRARFEEFASSRDDDVRIAGCSAAGLDAQSPPKRQWLGR